MAFRSILVFILLLASLITNVFFGLNPLGEIKGELTIYLSPIFGILSLIICQKLIVPKIAKLLLILIVLNLFLYVISERQSIEYFGRTSLNRTINQTLQMVFLIYLITIYKNIFALIARVEALKILKYVSFIQLTMLLIQYCLLRFDLAGIEPFLIEVVTFFKSNDLYKALGGLAQERSHMAPFALMCLGLGLYRKGIFDILSVLGFALIIISGSRIMIGVAIFQLFVFYRNTLVRISMTCIVIIAVVNLANGFQSDGSIQTRLFTLIPLYKTILDHLVLGTGLGLYGMYSYTYWLDLPVLSHEIQPVLSGERLPFSHNLIFRFIAEFGLLGITVILLFLRRLRLSIDKRYKLLVIIPIMLTLLSREGLLNVTFWCSLFYSLAIVGKTGNIYGNPGYKEA